MMKKLLKALSASAFLLCLSACGLASVSEPPAISDEASAFSEELPVFSDDGSAFSEIPTVSESNGGTEAPGTLTDVDKLPTADGSEIGEKISVGLALNGKVEISFAIRRNTQTGEERLVTIERLPNNESVMLLSVYETSLDGEGLYKALETGGCDAILAARIYIDWIEGMYTINSFHHLIKGADTDGFLQSATQTSEQCLFGLICRPENVSETKAPVWTSNEKRSVYLYAADEADAQKQSLAAVWQRIYDRFDDQYGWNALVSVE